MLDLGRGTTEVIPVEKEQGITWNREGNCLYSLGTTDLSQALPESCPNISLSPDSCAPTEAAKEDINDPEDILDRERSMRFQLRKRMRSFQSVFVSVSSLRKLCALLIAFINAPWDIGCYK